jgi:hypothetical protein
LDLQEIFDASKLEQSLSKAMETKFNATVKQMEKKISLKISE